MTQQQDLGFPPRALPAGQPHPGQRADDKEEDEQQTHDRPSCSTIRAHPSPTNRSESLQLTRADEVLGPHRASQARYARALALINAGELDQGTDAATRAFQDAKLDQPSVLSCCELMAHAEAARNRPAHANLWADRADHIAHHTLDTNLGFSYLARAHGLRTIAPVTAAERARLAAETFATTDQRVDGGRARLCAGIAYAKVNEVGHAREQLEQAVEIFANCGARGLHAEALRELAGIG
ncbi:MAG: transcriptional regulator, LuxR family [Actinomycetia bacterium]|nr:transcriptional regulator, LuxR family [Actinomycetes bacterium]